MYVAMGLISSSGCNLVLILDLRLSASCIDCPLDCFTPPNKELIGIVKNMSEL